MGTVGRQLNGMIDSQSGLELELRYLVLEGKIKPLERGRDCHEDYYAHCYYQHPKRHWRGSSAGGGLHFPVLIYTGGPC